MLSQKHHIQTPPHRGADAEQEIWIPACFAIPWLLGQQVRHKKQQMHQTKETGCHWQSSPGFVGAAGQGARYFHVAPFDLHTTTIADMAARSSAIIFGYWIGHLVLLVGSVLTCCIYIYI